jgi:hypothetical protein
VVNASKFFVGGASAPTLFFQIIASRSKSIGAEAPPTIDLAVAEGAETTTAAEAAVVVTCA